ncbi:MAG: GatB/YqeY domain-containing protein, partial [Bacillota bacterium]
MLKDKLRQDFNLSRKEKDLDKKAALEAVLAAILQKEKTQLGKTVSDDEVLDCLTKEIKVQNEIMQMYKEKDAIKSQEAQRKADILFSYLPKQLTENEVLEMIKELDIYEDTSNRTKGM